MWLVNCWIVAMKLWIKTKAKHWAAVRRSKHFLGLIPHFAVFSSVGRGNLMKQVQYIPPIERDDVGVNLVVLFDGYYDVTYWRKVGSGKSKDLKEATILAITEYKKAREE